MRWSIHGCASNDENCAGGDPGISAEERAGARRIGLSLLLMLVALAAPWIAPYSPTAQDLPARLMGPTAHHWMGTDELGRDILSRIIFGTRVSMLVSICVVFG